MQIFADASLAIYADVSSLLGLIVMFVGQYHNLSVIIEYSTNCKRVIFYVLPAELYTISDVFYPGRATSHTLGTILGREADISVFTDSRTLFD